MFKIFVGNLGQNVTEDDVRQLFERHAVIDDIALPKDEKGKLRGFAIVMIKDPQQGRMALMAARGTRLQGRMLIINQARKKGKAPPKRSSRRASFRSRSSGMYGVRNGPGGGGRFGSSGGGEGRGGFGPGGSSPGGGPGRTGGPGGPGPGGPGRGPGTGPGSTPREPRDARDPRRGH